MSEIKSAINDLRNVANRIGDLGFHVKARSLLDDAYALEKLSAAKDEAESAKTVLLREVLAGDGLDYGLPRQLSGKIRNCLYGDPEACR